MKTTTLKLFAGVLVSVAFAGSLLLLAVAQLPPPSTVKETVLTPTDSLDQMPILELANKLTKVQEKYGSIDYSTHLARFDSESAKRDGVSSVASLHAVILP